jgi:hypothetical protein
MDQQLSQEIRKAVSALAVSLGSIREADDLDADERSELIAESQNQFTKYVNDLVLTDIRERTAVEITKDETTMPTRAELYSDLKKRAAAQRQDGESPEQGLARYVGTPGGRAAFAKYRDAPGTDYDAIIAPAAPAAPVQIVKHGPAMLALHKRADEIRHGTAMTRQQAVAKIATDLKERELWKKAKSENVSA